MRRLESLMLGAMTVVLIVAIFAWTALPAAAQTVRDGVNSAAGEPTDPEKSRLGLGATTEANHMSSVRPTVGTQSPVLSQHSFSDQSETFLNLLRRFGILVPMGLRP